jgi:hypothetical protein
MPARSGSTSRVIDGDLVSSRKPDDIPALNGAMIDVFSKARAGV